MTNSSDLIWFTAENGWQYDEYVRPVFARVYPVIADQILERTGITTGTCLDVGSGPASLALALASLSDLHVTALDSSPEMVALAHRNIRQRCMEDHVIPALGDVQAIPAVGATFNLVVSRGSFHSWILHPAALREISRVLRRGGIAYIGGGYGNARIRDEIYAEFRDRGLLDVRSPPGFSGFRKVEPEEIRASMGSAGIRNYRIINDDSGLWIIIRKPEEEQIATMPEAPNSRKDFPVFHNGFFFPQ